MYVIYYRVHHTADWYVWEVAHSASYVMSTINFLIRDCGYQAARYVRRQ